jgi:hypothetical protein
LDQDTPPPPQISHIQEISAKVGFFIDKEAARRSLSAGIDPSWFEDTHSFLEFVALKVKEKYRDKPQAQMKSLYIAAVREWDDLRQEYPVWREAQEKKAAEKARINAINAAKAREPEICQCGGNLKDNLVCEKCRGWYKFDEAGLQYQFHESIDFAKGYQDFIALKDKETTYTDKIPVT